MVTSDGAGASHALIERLDALAARPGRHLVYSVGWELGERERAAITAVPEAAWQIAIDHRGEVRERRSDDSCAGRRCGHRRCWIEKAHVTELTALLRQGRAGDQLAGWPASMRVFARRERPHPGAQLSTDMTRFPTAGHLVSWARLAPGIKESAGKKKGKGSTGHGNAYLAAILGNAAAGAGKTDTFLGERYRRIARRRGSKRAIVAISRSIMVIAWHLLSDPDAQFHDLGPGFYAARIDPERRKRTHIRQLEALGYTVTLQPAA